MKKLLLLLLVSELFGGSVKLKHPAACGSSADTLRKADAYLSSLKSWDRYSEKVSLKSEWGYILPKGFEVLPTVPVGDDMTKVRIVVARRIRTENGGSYGPVGGKGYGYCVIYNHDLK